jgi:hypothetical protein
MERGSSTAYPHQYIISLPIHPVRPVPISLYPQIEYTDKEGKVATASIPPISLLLTDLFSHPPLPTVPSVSPEEFLEFLWTKLWSSPQMVKSLRVLHMPFASLVKAFSRRNITPFFLASSRPSPDSALPFVGRALIALIPHSHLLFQAKFDKERSVVKLRTEEPRILQFIDPFFDTLKEENNGL